jgi:DNA-binding SARP family transcriptional activator
MSALLVHLFGSIRVSHGGLVTLPALTHTTQALLAFLVLHRSRLHGREQLASRFWGDQSERSARGCLNTALWRLRQVLEPAGVSRGTYLTTRSSGEIGFNVDSEHWIDVDDFERVVAVNASGSDSAPIADAVRFEAAAALYSTDFLEAFYDDWAICERERFRLLYLQAMARLMRHHRGSGALDQACRYAKRIIELDPLREEIHRELIRLHIERGDRAQAVQQYRACRETLVRELGVEPMEETRALHTSIVATEGPVDDDFRHGPVNGVLESTRAILTSVDHLRAQLSELVARLERRAGSERMR